jgi:endonuclease/exonuclease/phosphatase family metal-dependent hydrolase
MTRTPAPPLPELPDDSARRLRLLSYNIQGGAGVARFREYVTRGWTHVLPHPVKRRNLASVATLLEGYDIVALQEADGGSLRSSFQNQVQHLAESAGFPFWSHQANRKVGRIVEVSNGVLSRPQPSEIIDHKLPGAIPGRGALEVRYGNDVKNGLHVIIAHLALTVRARRQQIDYLIEMIGDLPHVVLMGDLNTTAASPEMRALFSRTRLQMPTLSPVTYPSWQPKRAIDHVLVSDALLALAYEVPLVTVSDHLPIALTIALPDACAF